MTADDRLEPIVSLVMRLAAGDLSARGEPSGEGDGFDAVMVGINMLAEDLEASVAELEGRVRAGTSELHAQGEFLQALVENLQEGVVACDAEGRMTSFNAAARAMLGWDLTTASRTEVAAAAPLLSPVTLLPLAQHELPLSRALRGEVLLDEELIAQDLQGRQLLVACSGRSLHAPDGQVSGAVMTMRDVTGERASRAVLMDRATRDELTGLDNRYGFKDALDAALQHARVEGGHVAVLLLDVDDFKNVNDSLGHQVGDELLVAVAGRISSVLRNGDTAARIGGDEFVLLLDRTSEDAAVGVAHRLLSELAEPLRLAGVELTVTGSIGVVVSNEHDVAESLLGAADMAMYLAKNRGKGGVALFEPKMQLAARDRLSMESDLRRALREQRLHLTYQPIVDLETGRMSGVEALCRWTDAVRGAVPPTEFIPIAEETGLVVPLGVWVLCEAAAQHARWLAEHPGAELRLSVNVSTRQLERPGLVDALDELLAGVIRPQDLILEITETALSLDQGAAAETLLAIRDRGVHLAVDDFGTGHSSLDRLRSAPVSRLKVDRSFVSEITDADSDVPIVDATLAMALGLGLGVVAEGIETVAQLRYLRRRGCVLGQGYLFARPQPADAIGDLLAGRAPWAELLDPPDDEPSVAGDARPWPIRTRLAEADAEGLVLPLLDELRRTTGLTSTYLLRIDESTGQQRLAFASGGVDPLLGDGDGADWAGSLCKHALDTGIRRTSEVGSLFPELDSVRQLGLASFIVEPIHDDQGRLFAAVCGAARTPVPLTDAHSATFRVFARMIADKLRAGADQADLTAPARSPDRRLPRPARRLSSPTELLNRSAALRARRIAARHAWDARTRPDQDGTTANRTAGDVRSSSIAQQIQDALDRHSRAMTASDRDEPDVSRLRIMLVDDDAMTRDLLTLQIGVEPGLHLVAESDSGAAAVGIAVVEQPDILVLDYNMHGDLPAEEVVTALRRYASGTRILLHSGQLDVHQTGQRLGVDRALSKDSGARRLIEALHALGA